MFLSTRNYRDTNTTYITAFSVLLLLLASEVCIPIGAVPITLQTFVVFLLGLRLDKRSAVSTGLLFIAIKFVTLPFFACPSFGYIIGMGISIPAMCYIRQITRNQIISCVVAYLITNTLGSIWLYSFIQDWTLVWQYGLEPFILIEMFKATMAICISKHLTHNRNND